MNWALQPARTRRARLAILLAGIVLGQFVPILRTNHAIRGVVAPAGRGRLEFRYEPASFTWGLRLCGLGVVGLLGLFVTPVLRRKTNR